MYIVHEIGSELSRISRELSHENLEFDVSVASDFSKGDMTTNIALVHFKKLGCNSPQEAAIKIAAEYEALNDPCIEKIEVAGPGFINFFLSSEYLANVLTKNTQEDQNVHQGSTFFPQKKKVIVEYSSPNIAKPFTIGHLRSTIIGDAVANLLESQGHTVMRDNHLGDWGSQFGKQIYAIKTWGNMEEIERSENPVKELVALYVKFHEEAEKDSSIEDQGRMWFQKLESGDSEARELWQKCINWSMREFERIYSVLGVTFTENGGQGYGESFFEDKMQVVIEELRGKGLLTKSEGAELVYFPDEKYPPLMILKKDGTTLYATRDLATDKFRLSQYPDATVINEVGIEQELYFRQLFEVEKMLGWVRDGQRIHVKHGHYRFSEGKMSTRKGNAIWLDDVLREAEGRAADLAKENEKNPDMNVIRKIAIGGFEME